MNRLFSKSSNAQRRQHRVRARITGSTERPRLNVFVSNQHITAQIIDDEKQHTLVAVTTVGQKNVKGSMTDKAVWVGTEVAKKAKTAKISKVVFDRGPRLFHGRIKALAEAAREQGLEF